MSNRRNGYGFLSNGSRDVVRSNLILTDEEFPIQTSAQRDIGNSTRLKVNHNNGSIQQQPFIRSNAVVRYGGNRIHSSNSKVAEARRNSNSQQQQQHAVVNNNIQPSSSAVAASATTRANNLKTHQIPSQPHVSYKRLTNLINKTPDEILNEMLRRDFQLKMYLNNNRMRSRYDWISTMTTLLEQITKCSGSRERIVMILEQLLKSSYVEGVYGEVRTVDPITGQLRFHFIQSFLKVSRFFLATIPHSADELTKIFERLELAFTKVKFKSPEYEETKAILDEIIERINEIDRRKNQPLRNTMNIATGDYIEHDADLPPDDYRYLQIVPDITEMLSKQTPFLRENIHNGVYRDPQDYLDIHFRLLREDFVGPLRDGIQQYLSEAEGKNFNVRIYKNVHLLGPRLSPRSGIVYDLWLDTKMASKVSWANSRRLIYGNLLVLTYDEFKSCVFVTVEDRSRIEEDYLVSVKKLEKLNNNNEQSQIDLDGIDFSYTLTMIETTTYFEAYRPVLNALQLVNNDQAFPLAPYILKLDNEMIPPDYIQPTTTYDFTPLLVDPDSDVKTNIIRPGMLPKVWRGSRRSIESKSTNELQIIYKQSNEIAKQFKSILLLDKDKWPTSDELHLNPKQREALILALTNKVALIQGPPGTGKTFLGVRITEMLLYNRSKWCLPNEQSTPILMICHTNHALDQFLELIVRRLKIKEGSSIIRVGNRCQNEVIRPFSLLNARRLVRENRAIPNYIYHQRHAILDKKVEAEEALKIHEFQMEQSRTQIVLLALLIEHDVIERKHISSLLAPYHHMKVETALWDWLGLSYEYQRTSEDLIDLTDAESAMSNMNMNSEEDNVDETKQRNDEKKLDEKKKEEEEEEEEEERRRDELDIDEEFDRISAMNSETTTFNSVNKRILPTDGDGDSDSEGKWQVVKKKPYDRRRLIRYILQHATTLTDQRVSQIDCNLWELPAAERYNLYRYWLLRYQQCLHNSVREVRRAYNQAICALAEYHQEEDYYILKDSIIVAMTTTCAAKYHNVLEKLQSKIVIVEEAAAIFEAHIITALSSKCQHLILIGDHIQLRPNPNVYRLATKFHIDISLFERFIKNNFPNVRLNIQHRMRPEIARLMKHFYDDLEDHISVKTARPSIVGIQHNVFFINHSNIETTVVDGSSKRNEFEANYVIELVKYLRKQDYKAEQITILVMYLGQRQLIAKQARNIKLLRGVRIMVTDNYQGEENEIIILSLVRSNSDKKIGFLKTTNRICVALSRARCGLFVIGNMTLLAEVNDIWNKIAKSLSNTNEIGNGLSLSCLQHSKERFIADRPESFLKRREGGCDKPCDARLKCGHSCQLMCHNYDTLHKEIVCSKPCNEVLPCGHPCKSRCHILTPNQHKLCRILVEKTITSCGHKIKFECEKTPTSEDCQCSVLKRLSCDHFVNVPCRFTSSPSKLKQFSCPKPCNTVLACKHKCKGTCGKCYTGRLHISCQEKCERSLICSHVCKAPCASNCPPCLRDCEVRCVHSKCKKKCGETCIPCKEPCAYKCKHHQCKRLCSEPCDRPPCNEPCDQKLKCGHDCIGICGEPCPSQCRICNKHIVQDIFFGTEDEPNARFVFLPDCRHLIEVTGLDRFIEDSLDNSQEKTAIRFPECPRCKQKIRRCTRYMPIINRLNNLIETVKLKILGNRSADDINNQRERLIDEYEQTKQNLKEIDSGRMNKLLNRLYNEDDLFSYDGITLMKNILLFLNEIDKLLIDGRKKLSLNIFEDLVSVTLMNIVEYLFAHHQCRNFADQEINDIEAELARIRRLISIENLVSSFNKINPTCSLKVDEQQGIDSMQYLTKKIGPFTKDDQLKFDSLAKKLEHLHNLPGLGITERERVAIVSALNLTKGHWYVCPNGHPYVITECGGASQESECPDCREKIGGRNHRLVSTNRHFGMMDNSQYAAWSNEANINIPQQL